MSSRATTSLHLLRHADAGDPGAWHGDDADRPLSDKGVAQAERLAQHLSAVGFEPDVVLASPKRRALATARIVAGALDMDVLVEERLAGHLDIRTVERLLEDAGRPRRPVLVGHDPDFSQLLAELAGAPGLEMKKGALARLDVPDALRAGGGQLRWLLPPDLLPRQR